MKLHLIKILLLIFFPFFCSAPSINDALKKRIIREESKWRIKSQEETISLRHGSNLSVKLINLTSISLSIEIPSGTLFSAVDSSKQNMLLTENILVDLLPYQSSTSYCTVYCCESNDAAPTEEERYSIRKPATQNLQRLAEFISQKKFEGYGVQRSIWCISNNKNLSDISAGDSAQIRQLVYFTGNLAHYKPAEIEKAYLKASSVGKDFEKIITLDIPVSTNETELWIVIQNCNNNTLQTVMRKQKVAKGILKKQFGVSSIDLGTGDFIVRVYSTDRPAIEKKFTLKA